MKLARLKACICEGSAERAIIDLLLDAHLLIFERSELLEERVIRCRNASSFERDYLRMSFSDKISIIRVLDSRKEPFKLSKAYKSKIEVIDIVTAPEIEMLIIINENKYNEFKKSKKKPSIFCKENLKMHDVKSYEFVKGYFSNVNDLLHAIKKYKEYSKVSKNEHTLNDLLK